MHHCTYKLYTAKTFPVHEICQNQLLCNHDHKTRNVFFFCERWQNFLRVKYSGYNYVRCMYVWSNRFSIDINIKRCEFMALFKNQLINILNTDLWIQYSFFSEQIRVLLSDQFSFNKKLNLQSGFKIYLLIPSSKIENWMLNWIFSFQS